MGRDTDFDFGANAIAKQGVASTTGPTPTYAHLSFDVDDGFHGCNGLLVCPTCGHSVGYCGEVAALIARGQAREPSIDYPARPYQLIWEAWNRGQPLEWESWEPMDLGKYKSKDRTGKFEKRDWIDASDFPKNKPRKWRIDGWRDSKKKGKEARGIIGFVDLTAGKLKRVMSIRTGFTLDAFCDELGTNTDKWAGKFILLEPGGSDNQYINVAQ
jgi:hypothetical protein